MPRPLRVVLPGHTLHLIQRGNDRLPCFHDDTDRAYYLATLLHASERARCDVHAYVLMTNHVHLLVTAREASAPARMMHALGSNYVRYFNERHGRTGTLWEGRYRSSLIDSERYFLECSRYVETNPVRGGNSVIFVEAGLRQRIGVQTIFFAGAGSELTGERDRAHFRARVGLTHVY